MITPKTKISEAAGKQHNPWRKRMTWQVIPETPADTYCVTQFTLEDGQDWAQVILPALTHKEATSLLSTLYHLQEVPRQRWAEAFRAKLVDLAGTSKFLGEWSHGVNTMACHQNDDPVTSAERWFTDLMKVKGNPERLAKLKV